MGLPQRPPDEVIALTPLFSACHSQIVQPRLHLLSPKRDGKAQRAKHMKKGAGLLHVGRTEAPELSVKIHSRMPTHAMGWGPRTRRWPGSCDVNLRKHSKEDGQSDRVETKQVSSMYTEMCSMSLTI